MTREIPENEWVTFFNSLSEEKGDCTVSITVINNDYGEQVLCEKVPLRTITFDPDAKKVLIAAVSLHTDNQEEDITHIVDETASVWVKEDEGSITYLEIESKKEGKALVHFFEKSETALGKATQSGITA